MGVVVRQKTKGKGQPWWVICIHNKIYRSKKVGDRKAAEAVASEIRRRLASGAMAWPADASASGEATSPEFSAFVSIYMDRHAKPRLKYNTWQGYQNVIDNHLLPVWKNKRLDEIERDTIKSFLLEKGKSGLSIKTVQNIQVLISGMMSYACEEKFIPHNPAAKLGKWLPRRGPKPEMHFLSKEQVTAFLEVVQHSKPEHYPFFLTAFRTGMRLGELLGLAWEDIDLNRGILTVCRAFTHGRFETPKSGKRRRIDMTEQLKTALAAHKETVRRTFEGLPACSVPKAIEPREEVHLVFPNRDGRPTDGDNLRTRVFYELTKEANCERLRIHDMRHTFASLLLQNNAPLHYVKEQMGHASITTTVDVYGHLVPGQHRDTINGLDDPAPKAAVNPPLRMAS